MKAFIFSLGLVAAQALQMESAATQNPYLDMEVLLAESAIAAGRWQDAIEGMDGTKGNIKYPNSNSTAEAFLW